MTNRFGRPLQEHSLQQRQQRDLTRMKLSATVLLCYDAIVADICPAHYNIESTVLLECFPSVYDTRRLFDPKSISCPSDETKTLELMNVLLCHGTWLPFLVKPVVAALS